MRRNGVKAASARLAASLIALLGLVGLAQGGDRASFSALGYGPDTRIFAYEEYGIQDGSGLAYSSIYIVDLEKDEFLGDSPYRIIAGEDAPDTPLFTIRQKVLAKAQPELRRQLIGEQAEILSLIGDGVPDTDGKSIAFAPSACCGPGDVLPQRLALKLATFPVTPGAGGCVDEHPVGFSLQLSDGAITTEIYRDGETVPKSRGCPLDYRLYAVLQPLYIGDGRLAVVSVYSLGFEGPDRRFIVVPVPGE